MTDCDKMLEEMRSLLDLWHKKKRLPKRLGIVYNFGSVKLEIKERKVKMQFSGMSAGWTVSVSVVGINSDGTQNPAVLSAQAYQMGDPTVATVEVNPDGTGTITLVGTPSPGASISTTLTATATATLSGATGVVTGTDTLVFAGGSVPPPVLPTGLGFTYGTPVAPGTPPVPPPVPNPSKKF